MTTHAFDIDALNAICVSLGGNGGHRLQVDALNEWCSKAGKAAGHTRSVAAYNALAGGTSYAFDLQALNDLSGDLGGATNATSGIAALNTVADKVAAGPPWGPPANAKVYIDFVAQRAWTQAANAEVAISTLIGADPTTNAGWSVTVYPDAGQFTAAGLEGYDKTVPSNKPFALLGAAKTLMLAGATIVLKFAARNIAWKISWGLVDTAGNECFFVDAIVDSVKNRCALETWNGPLGLSEVGALVNSSGATNADNGLAATMGPTLGAFSANGRAAKSATLGSGDWVTFNAFVLDHSFTPGAPPTPTIVLKSITIYPPQPDAALPGLSV